MEAVINHFKPHKAGLAVGSFYALCHFLWVIMVAAGIAKPFLDWVLSLHFLTVSYSISAFHVVPALTLVIFAFAAGYVVGWVLAAFWKAVNR